MNHGLEHLQGQEGATANVLVIDFDTLSCLKAVASNVSEWGCSLTCDDANELRKNIGIRIDENSQLTRATVTGVKGNVASVIFPKHEEQVHDKRRERRNQVDIPVKISDREGVTELTVTIVDAGKNGCRVKGKGLKTLPEEVVLHLKNFERPVLGEFAWRNEAAAGIRLIWDMPDAVG
ncbi:PilZ domain-containing protein [Roseibium sp.]|uniref:PilZ domain-containing protein n=1 Tax=Roseibium sp. TaxID=1936156 RepID=UPI003A98390C